MKAFKIPVATPSLGEQELRNVIEAVRSGWVGSKGKFVKEFETEFARYIGVKYGVATSNGTTALHLALSSLEMSPEDEVIIPTLTFAAVANAILYTGAKPVFVDSHPTYWCIDPNKIEKKITERTKVIVPVHLYGHPCDMNMITKIAKDYGLYIVEDCAEAHGAEYKDKRVGSFGDIACFSFYANKIITTGEGGMCLTNDRILAERMELLRDHGMRPEKKYWHEVVGFNYRMTNLQAALGVAQSKKIDMFIKKKREVAKIYSDLLRNIDGITLHPEMSWAKNAFWLYSILVDEEKFGVSRDELMNKLVQRGIETRRFFYPIHSMPPYRNLPEGKEFPVADRLACRGLNLPSSVKLAENEVCEIVEQIRKSSRA